MTPTFYGHRIALLVVCVTSLVSVGSEIEKQPGTCTSGGCRAHDHSLMQMSQGKKRTAGEGNKDTVKETVITDSEQLVRKGSFLVIGDWGWDPNMHGNLNSANCQKAIAQVMDQTMSQQGDVKFVINVGDSFYPRGVSSPSDPQWDQKWRQIYSPQLRSVPWYSVYGNHDHLEQNCICGKAKQACAQINSNIHDLNHFYMPDFSWSLEHPELGIEVLALEWTGTVWASQTCTWSGCQQTCQQNLQARASDAFALFNDRMAKSPHSMVVFSHYPLDYFANYPNILGPLSNASRPTVFFGGHRHNTDQNGQPSIGPNTPGAWLVGGGGGWGLDGGQQGIVLGEIMSDGSIRTSSRIVPLWQCQY